MHIMKLEELKTLIVHNLDVVEFLDIIGRDISDLVEAFEDDVSECFDDLAKAGEGKRNKLRSLS